MGLLPIPGITRQTASVRSARMLRFVLSTDLWTITRGCCGIAWTSAESLCTVCVNVMVKFLKAGGYVKQFQRERICHRMVRLLRLHCLAKLLTRLIGLGLIFSYAFE